MSSYKPWKALERRHAKRMKGVRLWRQDFAEVAPDGETEKDIWDCKALSKQAVVRLFWECRAKYVRYAAGRRFHLCLFDPTRPQCGDLIVITASRFEELMEKETLLDSHVAAFIAPPDAPAEWPEATWLPPEC